MDEIRLHTDLVPDSSYEGYIRFDDGGRVDFSVCTADGTGVLTFPERLVSHFEIHTTDIRGQAPRLTEIEAFDRAEEAPLILMAVDENDDFAYDHWIPEGNTAAFRLYAYPQGSAEGWEDVNVSRKGSRGCKWEIDAHSGLLRVTCPPEGRAVVTISRSDGVSTTFTVSNPLPEDRQARLDRQRADLLQLEAEP